MTERTITVAIDPELHGGKEPESDKQRALWETLDTVWNLMREGSVRVVLADVREQLLKQGFTGMPSDEAVFEQAKASGDPEAPKSYIDLAPNRGDSPLVDMAGRGLYGAFSLLAEQVMADASEALDVPLEEYGE